MADTHASGGDHGDHHAGLFWIYMSVALVLAVCTASSFIFNELVRHTMLSVVMGFVFILGVAILKSCLVGYYFMHLKWDWRLLYFIIVPVFILGTMMVIILMPDTVIGPYATPTRRSRSPKTWRATDSDRHLSDRLPTRGAGFVVRPLLVLEAPQPTKSASDLS